MSQATVDLLRRFLDARTRFGARLQRDDLPSTSFQS
jgi:hypothetical protein